MAVSPDISVLAYHPSLYTLSLHLTISSTIIAKADPAI